MQRTMNELIVGIKDLGFGGFLSYSLFTWFLYLLVDGPIVRWIEKQIGLTAEFRWYDVIILTLWIGLYIYGIYEYERYLSENKKY